MKSQDSYTWVKILWKIKFMLQNHNSIQYIFKTVDNINDFPVKNNAKNTFLNGKG